MFVIVFIVCVAAAPALARPQNTADATTPIPIVSQTEVVGVDGSFNFSYETGNGIRVQEGGFVKPATGSPADSEGGDVQVIQGSYSYTAPDGQAISLRYVADENGFQPEGEHLPTSPPIPEAISKLLSQLPQQQDDSPANPNQPQVPQ